MQEISYSDISRITTKASCEVALMGARHARIEISAFIMRTFVLNSERNLQTIAAQKLRFREVCYMIILNEKIEGVVREWIQL